MNSNHYLLLSKVFVRLHWAPIIYKLLKSFFLGGIDNIMDIYEAEDFLSKISPDKGRSCVCNNTLNDNPSYDLQVIIPVYNVEQYIEECVDSVVNQQTKYRIKIVIINDGATDDSRCILKKYEKSDIITIIDQENRGLSGARNRGLEYIDAQYVMFVDSDDRLTEQAIGRLLDKAYQTNAYIVTGGCHLMQAGKIIGTKKYREEDDAQHTGGYAWGKIYKSELFRNISFPEGYWFEDTLNSLVIADMPHHNVIINDVVYDYRQNPKGITQMSKGNARCIDTYWVTRRLLDDRQKLGLPIHQRLYDQMLKQVSWNCIRVASLGIAKVNQALFSCVVDMWGKDFKGFYTTKKEFVDLEGAIRSSNYKLYMLACFLNR